MPRSSAGSIGLRGHARAGSLLVAAAMVIAALAAALQPAISTAAESDPAAQALATINQYRAWLGIPPMTRNPALDAAASKHATYYQLNFGDPSLAGMGLHQEQPGRPGFIGADMQDRAESQGYGGWVNENIGLSGSLMTSLDWFIGTINHRLTLIDPRYTDIGFGVVNVGNAKIEVIDVGAPNWSDTAQPEWVAWPPDGTTGVGTSFSGEAPDPFSGVSYPIGYPITLKYFGSGGVTFDSATLTADGQSIPAVTAIGDGWLTRQTYLIAATQPLNADTTYTVSVSGTASGTAFNRSWSFHTAVSDDESLALASAPALASKVALPPGVAAADAAVRSAWASADGAVESLQATRTWLWGPDAFAARQEPYAEAPGGQREVYYFDKGRMEITDPGADRNSPWFVTNGLLVRDLILGAAQTGNNAFETSQPAQIPLAGDPAKDNPDAPTYASLHDLASLAGDRRVDQRSGQPVQETLNRAGELATDASLAGYTTYSAYDDVTGHNIAAVFSDWLAQQDWDPIAIVGRPISEAYWVRTRIGGSDQWVLVQAFERRLLTYTPSNPAEWQIETGNVGRAYYEWRYGEEPAGS